MHADLFFMESHKQPFYRCPGCLNRCLRRSLKLENSSTPESTVPTTTTESIEEVDCKYGILVRSLGKHSFQEVSNCFSFPYPHFSGLGFRKSNRNGIK
ncbi:hypothetical protein TNCV_3204711 [Trichonephila clavipes]|nr:hypothetical protein TNCV_3204711 [Trichonephila clavipes]